MKQGDYSGVFREAAHRAKLESPTFLQIWILTECSRKTKNFAAFRAVVADIQKLYSGKAIAAYAELKHCSLAYALCLEPPVDSKRLQAASADLKKSWDVALPFAADSLPLGVAMAHMEVEATLPKRDIVASLAQKNPLVTDLILWQARSFINGRVSRPIDPKSGKPKVDRQGRPIYNLNWPDAPDLAKALAALKTYEKQVPGEPLAEFYRARIESANAYFSARNDTESKKLTASAKQRLGKFRAMPDIPLPLARIAESFEKLPYPGTFVTRPTE